MKNKYIKVSHISEVKFREIVKLFSEDLSATQIANLTKLNRNTINRYLILFRERFVMKFHHYQEKLKLTNHILEQVEFEGKEDEVLEEVKQ